MTEIKNNPVVKSKLIRTFADPVLIYTVIGMMAIMDHYREELTLMYGLVSYVAGWLIFRLFDFINKHHFLGIFAYVALFAAFYEGAVYSMEKGKPGYPITWGLWFLTPQSALQYNKWYTVALFLLFLIFMLSVIYYFTRVRYRMFMNFLILIIPFSIYGKENEKMKIGYIIALAVGYVVIMALFRQLSDTKEAEVVDRPEIWRSAAVFTVLFAAVAALCPKPAIEADRTMIETLINADVLTDKFMEMLSVFRDDADGSQFRRISNTVLYYVQSPLPMQLKTSTFTTYDFKTDKWTVGDTDKRYKVKDEYPFSVYRSGEITAAIREAVLVDSVFAEKYGISALADMEVGTADDKIISIKTVNVRGDSAPVPQGAKKFLETSYDDDIGLSYSGAVYCDKGKFGGEEFYRYSFVPSDLLVNPRNEEAVILVGSVEDQEGMVNDAIDALHYYADHAKDEARAEKCRYYADQLIYGACPDDEALLDYGGSKKIKKLAEDLTDGLTNDFDKAKVLEWYFINNGYHYDTEYQKRRGDNAEDFLFDSKTGVCYEYATAMVLMARSIGIPARYCEGYNMQNKAEDQAWDTFVVTSNDAHGFPELYIKGVGWMGFEPTMTTDTNNNEQKSIIGVMAKFGVIILGISVLAIIIILLMPIMTHKFFLLLCRRRSPNRTARAVIQRICRIYGISGTSTAHEAEAAVRDRSGADISAAAKLFDKAEYGGAELDENDKAELIGEYISAYEALRAAKKAERKNRKNEIKALVEK